MDGPKSRQSAHRYSGSSACWIKHNATATVQHLAHTAIPLEYFMMSITEQSVAANFLLCGALWRERSSQLQEDPAVTEEALIAEDVKADIYQEEGGLS